MSAKNKKGGGQAGGRSGGPAGSQPGKPGPKRPYSTIVLKATDITPKSGDTNKAKDQAKSKNAAPEFGSAAKTHSGKTGTSSTTGGSGTAPAASSSATSSAGKSAAPASSQTAAKSKPSPSKPSAGSKAPPPQTPASPKQKSGGGFFSHMSAAIVGAVLTLFGAKYADQYIQIPGLPISGGATGAANSAASPELTARLAKLEQAVATGAGASSAANSPDIAALTDGLAAAQARLSKLEALGTAITDLQMSQVKLQDETADLRKTAAAGGTDGAAESAALKGRLAQLEQTLTALGAAADKDPDNAGRIPQLAAISGRLNDLETALKTRITGLRRDLVEEFDKRSANLSEASQSAKSGTQRLDRDVTALRASTARLDQRLVDMDAGSKQMRESLRVVQEATGNLKVALESMNGDLTARLKQTAKPADVSAAIAPISKKISALEHNLQSVVQSEDARKSNAKRIVLALELGNLKRAIDRGKDFAPELAQVKQVAGGTLNLAALEAHSGGSIPTIAELQKEFSALSYKMIDAMTMKENATVMDRLLNGAKSMVRVRRVNHSRDDNSAEAIVGRMDSALKDGHLGAVLSEAQKLPDKAKAPAANWLANVTARQSVDQALGQIEAKLKSSLGGTTSDERG